MAQFHIEGVLGLHMQLDGDHFWLNILFTVLLWYGGVVRDLTMKMPCPMGKSVNIYLGICVAALSPPVPRYLWVGDANDRCIIFNFAHGLLT